MFKSSNSGGDLNGFLDAGSHMRGELHFEDTFRIDGKLTGGVVSDGDLIIGERGEVDGEVRVRRVFVSGTSRGTLRATEHIEITSSGRVFADLETPNLKIEAGAFFEGRCSMASDEKDRDASSPERAERDNVTPLSAAGRK